jgi:DNA-directed RNA polymerase subunit RPC12/RpoP
MEEDTEMEARSFVCPSCGSTMVFDSETQKMVCPYCGNSMEVEELNSYNNDIERDFSENNIEESVDVELGDEHKTGDFKVYRCRGCGAEVLTDDNTAATFCSFCGRPSLMEDRLTGELLPKYVIPFKIKKEDAMEMYTSWAKKGLLTPSTLRSKSTIDKITGMYVPFWLYDYNAEMEMEAKCTKVRSEIHGDYKYVHTDHFIVERDVETEYIKIPADASEKMPDDVMDKLEPFMYNQLEDFDMMYLSGYYAEKYNYDSDQMAPRIENRVKKYIYNLTRESIKGYSTVSIVKQNSKLRKRGAKYVMLPVWILNYTYNGDNHMFALNGQTGKIVADRPVSKAKMAAWFSGITTIVFTILMLMGRFLGR